MVRKNEFKKGDVGIYFEIDSYLDSTNPAFSFMEKKKYKVKTQRYTFGGKGNFISQGLLMSAEQFGWHIVPKCEPLYHIPYIVDNESHSHHTENESRFLTKQLGVTYAVPEDNVRKASSTDKYKKMAQRHGKLFAKQPYRWLMKREWGKKLLFLIFGKKTDKKNSWPVWVKKTDEERIENLPFLFNDKSKWIATEKIDGSSTTFTMKRRHWPFKDEFYVCSRNVCFDKPDKACYYDTNIYLEMAEKYNIENKMKRFLHIYFPNCKWITIQGETYGSGVQKRDYHLNDHEFMAFNFITSEDGRLGTISMRNLLEADNIPCVPVLNDSYILPDTIEELRDYVNSKPSVLDNEIKEGIVFRSPDGSRSFKCVSPEYLLKYHN